MAYTDQLILTRESNDVGECYPHVLSPTATDKGIEFEGGWSVSEQEVVG
ncbi:MAG: hypothetical protein IPJ66_14960 [Bacteroidetes bacterium]|nr:hypothetical protein [Bacteroidota bacterium]